MDPQLVALTEKLGEGIEQHKASSAFYREKGEGFVAAQAENKQKTDAAIADVSLSVAREMEQLASGSFTRYIAVDGNDETGTGTQASPFETVAKAIESVPAGMHVLINAIANDGGTFIFSHDKVTNNRGRYVSLKYLGTAKSAKLHFKTYSAAGRTRAIGLNGSGVFIVNGFEVETQGLIDELPADVAAISNTTGQLVPFFADCILSCSDVAILDPDLSGEMRATLVHSEMKKRTEKPLLFRARWAGSIRLNIAGSFSAEGNISDYFLSTSYPSVFDAFGEIIGNQ